MNTFTDAQLIVSRDVVDLLDRVERPDRRPATLTDEERETLDQLAEHGFLVDRPRDGARQSSKTFFRDVREGTDRCASRC